MQGLAPASSMSFPGSSPGCPPCELHPPFRRSLNRVQRIFLIKHWIVLEAGCGRFFALRQMIALRDFSCRIQERYLRPLRRKDRPTRRPSAWRHGCQSEGRRHARSGSGRRVRFANRIARLSWATRDERIGSVRSTGWWNRPSWAHSPQHSSPHRKRVAAQPVGELESRRLLDAVRLSDWFSVLRDWLPAIWR